MSWLFGYFGNSNKLHISSPEHSLHLFKDSYLILSAGGNNQTCFFKSNSMDSCWAVVGVGLKCQNSGYGVVSDKDWDDLLTSKQMNLISVGGHFVAVRYSNKEIALFTDELGLREFYVVKLKEGFGFTTRIDRIKYFIEPEINLKEFGSRWLLQNQISSNSIIKNVIRVVCTKAIIKNKFLSIEQNIWKPDFNATTNQDVFDSSLKKVLSIQNKKISLSLSGGLDSRLLLSYLVIKNYDQWETHTFGDPNHPDSKIACDLLRSFNRNNIILDDKLPSVSKLIELAKTYSVQSIVTNPVSSILNLRFYDRLSDQDKVIVDGGFGEIWRRAFANRLLLIGRNSLLKKDSKAASGFLRYNRADIYTKEALAEMEKGVVEQFDNLFQEMPDATKISPTKWINLFSIRSRLMNYYAPEQARVDQFVVSFMPLVQKEILSLLFGLKESDMKNGKMFKRLINQNAMQLTKHSLVKENITYPFNSSSFETRLQSKIKSKLGLNYRSKKQNEILNSLKEFIGDVIQSSGTRNYEYYDRKKLDKLANNFLSKERVYNSEVDWFISFELFRQGISK